LPSDLAYEQARPLLARALEREPRLWQARIGLADRELDEDRMSDTIALLEEGRTICPEEVSILRRQASTFFTYGWSAEAEETIQRIERLMPTSCSTLDWKLASARRRARFDVARQIAEKSVRCDVYSESLLEELRRANDFDGAIAEADRLFAIQPKSTFAAFETAKSAVAAGQGPKSIEAFKKTLVLAPSDPGFVVGMTKKPQA
jgi:tetratricopeptide (TPR) repeat protein